jgi:guanine deaminase
MALLIYGSLISPDTLTSYKALTSAICYVNNRGIIEIVKIVEEYDSTVTKDEIVTKFLNQYNLSESSVDIIQLEKGQFLIPGLIDTHTVRTSRNYACFAR